ncbi:MAG: hypothetical protein ACM3MK_08295 [Chitinophagales bacterium]
MEELKVLRDELFEQTTVIEQALLNLEKADILLNHWMQEYLYYEKPDPHAALAWSSGLEKGPHQTQSAQWYYEYESITQFISIVSDYVHNTKKELVKALKEA